MKFSIGYVIRIALVLIAIALALWVKDVRKVEFAPDLPDTTEEEVADTGGNYILPRSNGGLFTVPYEQYPTFTKAFEYARETLGDSASNGYRQWYVWRGGMFHTEDKETQ